MNDIYEEATGGFSEVYSDAPLADYQPSEDMEEPAYQEAGQRVRIITEKPKKKRKSKKGIGMVAIVLCFSLLGSFLGCGGLLLVQHYMQAQEPEIEVTEPDLSLMVQGYRENTVLQIVEIETGKVLTAAQVYAANAGSTVGITTSITTNYWGYQTTSAASGSGFIVTDDGYIITNYHVIEDSDSITVSLYNGDTYEAALIGYDENNDLAVLKIEAEELAPVILGDSDNLNVGDSVVAIGNPLGELTFSLTSGSISAKDREVTMSSSLTMNLLQTDCAINSGNSGGALFNLYGEVIGITNAKYSSSSSSDASIDNIGFAIPINDVRSIVESIIEKGYFSKPYLGVGVVDVSREYQIYGLPQGAAIQTITEGGPAEAAGLQVGDIIIAFNSTEITSRTELTTLIGRCKIGDAVILTVYRQGETVEVTVTIGEQIQSVEDEKQENSNSNRPGNFPWGRG